MPAAARDALEPLGTLPGGRLQVHLTGFMGCGKSTIGRLLARELLWNFLDLDALVQRHAGRSVRRIFEEDGEPEFRRLETFALRQAVQKPRTVVALGGGTLAAPENGRLCVAAGLLVWLRCPLHVLQGRLDDSDSGRPLWSTPEEMERLLAERERGYAIADLVVAADRDPEEITSEIASELRRLAGPREG